MSDQLLISMAEAAQLLGLTKPQLYELTRSRSRITHKLPVVRLESTPNSQRRVKGSR